MENSKRRFAGALYFPPIVAVAVAAAAVLSLPFLDKVANERMSEILAAAETDNCPANGYGCGDAGFPEPLMNIQPVSGRLDSQTGVGFGRGQRSFYFNF